MRRKGSPQYWERIRLIAANMFQDQLPPTQIARLLEVDDQTVRRWRRIWRDHKRQGLAARKPPGGPRKLSDEQKQQLLQMLRRPPGDFGLDAHLWTTRLMAALIEKKFGVKHHHDHVGALLRKLGWSVQRPVRRARERDQPRIDAWRQQLWPELEKKAAGVEARSSWPMKSAS
jgi:transposase